MQHVLRFLWKHPWALLGVGTLLAMFTASKLHDMAMIRGWVGGAIRVHKCVTDTWEQQGTGDRGGYVAWWVAFGGADIRSIGNHRMNVTRELFERAERGATMEVTYLPGDPTPYHRAGIYASDGNVTLDTVLLAVEGAMIAVALVLILRRLTADVDEPEGLAANG